MGNAPHDLLAGIYRPLLDRFRAAAKDPVAAQRASLERILRTNAGTEWGRAHGFAAIREPRDWIARAPAVEWDAVAPFVDRIANGEANVLTSEPVLRFVKTSGTTGPSKRIPITASLAREVRDAQIVWLVNLLRENPKHADGAKLVLVSPDDDDATPAGIPIGANTGRMQRALPWFVRFATRPAREVLAIKDPDLRAFLVALAAAGTDAGSITTANPSTLWLLAKRLREWSEPLAAALEEGGVPERRPDGVRVPAGVRYVFARHFKRRPKRALALRYAARSTALFPALWPRLTTINCWRGGPAAFWIAKLEPEAGGLPIRDPGISASEGFFAVPVESRTAAGVLYCGGPFMEFESGGTTRLAHELDVGAEYELRITTLGGLYRYAMRDVVRVAGRWENAPLVEFVRKSAGFLNVTGEKVTETQVLQAATRAAAETGARVAAAGAMIEMAEPPRYVALAEMEGDTTAFASAFDRALRAANVEYDGKRGDGRLAAAIVRVLPAGSFEARRRAKVQAGGPDTQVKTPVLFPDGW